MTDFTTVQERTNDMIDREIAVQRELYEVDTANGDTANAIKALVNIQELDALRADALAEIAALEEPPHTVYDHHTGGWDVVPDAPPTNEPEW